MLYGIIADIHSNLEAFETVLQQLRHVDRIVCAGDIVGYGPNPNECIRIMIEKKITSVAGNHDRAVIGEMSLEGFNDNARRAAEWTTGQLTADSEQYLKSLPLNLDYPELQVVHGSLRNPLEEYITNLGEAAATIDLMERPLCFVGHSHRPIYVGLRSSGAYDGREMKENDRIETGRHTKTLINPGGVGQPRDGDRRASYGVYDSENKLFTLFRIEYNILSVQEKMRQAGLPEYLIERLLYGR